MPNLHLRFLILAFLPVIAILLALLLLPSTSIARDRPYPLEFPPILPIPAPTQPITDPYHIYDDAIPLTTTTIRGPSSGLAGHIYAFSASIPLTDIVAPLTYTWRIGGYPADASTITMTGHYSSAVVSLAWEQTGTHLITATVANTVSVVTATHRITIGIPPDTVRLLAPLSGIVQQSYPLIAWVSPRTISPPPEYAWEANGGRIHNVQPIAGENEIGEQVELIWQSPGKYVITTTTSNVFGAQQTTSTVIIADAPPTSTMSLLAANQSAIFQSDDGFLRLELLSASIPHDTILIYTRQPLTSAPRHDGTVPLVQFSLEGYVADGSGMPATCCAPRATATIFYRNDVEDDRALRLLAWNGRTWIDVATHVNRTSQTMTAEITTLSRFLLVGHQEDPVFLPIILH